MKYEHAVDLLKSFLTVQETLTNKLIDNLELQNVDELLNRLTKYAAELNVLPHELIQVLRTHEFQSLATNLTPKSDLRGLITDRLLQNFLANDVDDVNDLNHFKLASDDIIYKILSDKLNTIFLTKQGRSFVSGRNVNERTPEEQIAYLEKENDRLKAVNEKLTKTVISQQQEILRMQSPNYIPGSDNAPQSPNINKRS